MTLNSYHIRVCLSIWMVWCLGDHVAIILLSVNRLLVHCVSKTCQLWWSVSSRSVNKISSVLLQASEHFWKLCPCVILRVSSCYFDSALAIQRCKSFHQCMQWVASACRCRDTCWLYHSFSASVATCWCYSLSNFRLETIVNCRALFGVFIHLAYSLNGTVVFKQSDASFPSLHFGAN